MDVGDGQEHLRTSTGMAAPTYMDELYVLHRIKIITKICKFPQSMPCNAAVFRLLYR